jgi:hypothetical protein
MLIQAASNVDNVEQANLVAIWFNIDLLFELFFDIVFIGSVGIIFIGIYLFFVFAQSKLTNKYKKERKWI